MKFSASRHKVERATKHIHDLNELLVSFTRSNFYAVSIQEHHGINWIHIDVDRSAFPTIDAALIIGDALHNLRSALDILYFQAMHETTGITNHRTGFPIREDRQKLISAINDGLKKKGLAHNPSALTIRDVVIDVVKASQAGNYTLWALHDMNIRDKHQLLIPVFDLMQFSDIRLEDDKKEVFWAAGQPYFTNDSCRFNLHRRGVITVKDKGHAATVIVFDVGVPLKNKAILPALNEIAECVTRTIDAFEAVELL
jgi:hypothetical protein